MEKFIKIFRTKEWQKVKLSTPILPLTFVFWYDILSFEIGAPSFKKRSIYATMICKNLC